jgi:uncharacterized protein (DUF885 family)
MNAPNAISRLNIIPALLFQPKLCCNLPIILLMKHQTLTIIFAGALLTACSGGAVVPPDEKPLRPDARVKAIADYYLINYLDRNPETVTLYGVPGGHHNKLTDNSLAALHAWEVKEDDLLGDLKQIDPATIASETLRATYAIARQSIEGDVAKRVCRDELWSVSQMTGWQVNDGYLVTIQPVGTPEARSEALERWKTLPKYIDNEIENLREGIKAGITAPKLAVRIVIDQVRTLANTPLEDSPFGSPIKRDDDPEFRKAFTALVRDEIVPATKRYADFLEREYLPAAREAIAVSANTNGAQCYEASVFSHSTVRKTAMEVHEMGVRENERLMAEMKEIGERVFHQSDVPKLLQTVRDDAQYKFKDRAEKIAYSQAALARAKAAIPTVFDLLPKADVKIEPYPKFREKNAPNEYNPPAADGSRPAVFLISAYQAENQSRAEDQSTAFHETIPGHHLQIAIAVERKQIHPLGRYLFNSGYGEGWGLYAERLADELKLYSSDLDRLGMLSGQALRASRLVVDSGMHAMGWTRQQAIDYLLAHTTEDRHSIESEVDRYIIWPGQATAYMIGRLEIDAAREEAKKSMGAKFDLKGFHDRILEDGAVPLAYLRDKIRKWSAPTR